MTLIWLNVLKLHNYRFYYVITVTIWLAVGSHNYIKSRKNCIKLECGLKTSQRFQLFYSLPIQLTVCFSLLWFNGTTVNKNKSEGLKQSSQCCWDLFKQRELWTQIIINEHMDWINKTACGSEFLLLPSRYHYSRAGLRGLLFLITAEYTTLAECLGSFTWRQDEFWTDLGASTSLLWSCPQVLSGGNELSPKGGWPPLEMGWGA